MAAAGEEGGGKVETMMESSSDDDALEREIKMSGDESGRGETSESEPVGRGEQEDVNSDTDTADEGSEDEKGDHNYSSVNVALHCTAMHCTPSSGAWPARQVTLGSLAARLGILAASHLTDSALWRLDTVFSGLLHPKHAVRLAATQCLDQVQLQCSASAS